MPDTHYNTPQPCAPKQAVRPAPTSRPKRKRITRKKQRQLLEATIERLVELLDGLDGEPDGEPNGDDEPSLGWTIPQEQIPQNTLNGYNAGDDREGTGSWQSASDDHEPSLGWSSPNTGMLPECEEDWRAAAQDPGMNQGHLHTEIFDGESEPSLGWTEGLGQGLHRLGSLSDGEEQCEDEGAQCEDEGAEDDRELDAQGFTNPLSAEYHTRQWHQHMLREFGETS